MKSFKEFTEDFVPSADYKTDKLGRKYPAKRIKIGSDSEEKETVKESVTAGNYVAIDAPDLDQVWDLFGIKSPKTGSSPPRGDYHCTLMYSKDTSLCPKDSLEKLNSVGCAYPIVAGVTGFDVFDDGTKAALVAKLSAVNLHKLHDVCRGIGMKHSYPEYSPHITLRYGMKPEEAHAYAEYLNSQPVPDGGFHFTVELHTLRSETVNEDYV